MIEVSGDSAKGTCTIEVRINRNNQSIIGSGYYADIYRRVDSEWKSAERHAYFNSRTTKAVRIIWNLPDRFLSQTLAGARWNVCQLPVVSVDSSFVLGKWSTAAGRSSELFARELMPNFHHDE
jgi:hypothetical protein